MVPYCDVKVIAVPVPHPDLAVDLTPFAPSNALYQQLPGMAPLVVLCTLVEGKTVENK